MDISSKKNIQVLISSHILSDIEQACSYVVILDKGRVAAQGKISDLKQVSYSLYEIKIKGDVVLFQKQLQRIKGKVEETVEGVMKVFIPPDQDPGVIFRIASQNNFQIRHFIKSQTSLEDLFADTVGVE